MVASFLNMPINDGVEAADKIVTFLTQVVGWSIAEDVTDTGSERDVVLSSPGETSNPNTVYIRLKGVALSITLYTYETFTDIGTNTGENTDATYGKITTSGPFNMIVTADLERVLIAVEEEAGPRYFGYVGRIISYYRTDQHPYPNLIKGMAHVSYDWFYSAAPRNMFMNRSDGTASQPYYPASPVDITTVDSTPSSRNGQVDIFRIPIVYKDVAAYAEIPGEIRGVYWVPTEYFSHGDFITVGSKTYVIIQGNGTYSWACGPVSNTGIPPQIPPGLSF